MADENQAAEGPGDTRLPLAIPIQTRDGSLRKDGKLVNMLVEGTANNVQAVVKRPGFTHRPYDGLNVPTGAGQGLLRSGEDPASSDNGTTFAIFGDRLFNAKTGQAGDTFDVGVFVNQQYQGIGRIAKMNQFAFVYGLGGVIKINAGGPSQEGYPDWTVPGIAILHGRYYVLARSDVSGGGYQLAGSGVNNPFDWSALNIVSQDPGYGNTTGIARHLNYIVSFSEFGMQLWYDAGLPPPGSVLAQLPNASFNIGCFNGPQFHLPAGNNIYDNGSSMQNYNDELFFLSQSRADGLAVHKLSGLNPVKISTPYIDKVLQRCGYILGIRSMVMLSEGHALYILTLLTNTAGADITLCYDITTGFWSEWTSTVDDAEESLQFWHSLLVPASTAFRGANQFLVEGTYLQHKSNGTIAVLGGYTIPVPNTWAPAYQDTVGPDPEDVQPISSHIVTQPEDWGTLNMKRFPAGFLHADTVNSSVQVRYSDDDYQTFSTYRSIDLSYVRKQLVRLGGSRRRSWEFLHTTNTPFRAFLWQLDIAVSNL